jgi:isopentenyl diphosphate isomerase/L-lactate dehydrogenase-like FMN-dependent dehydrogenase
LATAGVAGAQGVLELLREELSTTMALLGCQSVDDLNPDLIGPAYAMPCQSTPAYDRAVAVRNAQR